MSTQAAGTTRRWWLFLTDPLLSLGHQQLRIPHCLAWQPRLRPGTLSSLPSPAAGPLLHSRGPKRSKRRAESLAPVAGTWAMPPCSGPCSPFTKESGTVPGGKSRDMGACWLPGLGPRSVTRMPLGNSVTPGA